jgi:hypothetical protein
LILARLLTNQRRPQKNINADVVNVMINARSPLCDYGYIEVITLLSKAAPKNDLKEQLEYVEAAFYVLSKVLIELEQEIHREKNQSGL